MKTNEQQVKKIDMDQRDNPLMTVRTIKYYCHKENLFETPQLNQKLYLHYKGFKKIQSLQNYPNLVTIWLNNNCIEKIEGLSTLKNLICLYLNNNVISRIENLDGLDRLSVLHLAHNRIDRIEGLGGLKVLNILNVSENFLMNSESIVGLKQSTTLTSIDLSKNQLENSNSVFQVICQLQNITCLNMKNTPLSKSHKNYRKKLTSYLKNLKFLDDRPVKQIDHRLADAWIKGGPELENEQRIKIANQLSEKNKRQSIKLNQRISRQQKREKQLSILLQKKLELQSQDTPQSIETAQQLLQLQHKIQILKDGPKGFQASITDTSIKILHVAQEEQQKIINRYFYNEKAKIEENLNKIRRENLNEREVTVGDRQGEILERVRKSLGLDAEGNGEREVQERCNRKWKEKYEKLLQALLFKEKFNFQNVTNQFNKIMKEVAKRMMVVPKKFTIRELQYIWTTIQLKRQKLNSNEIKPELPKDANSSSQYQQQQVLAT